MSKVIDHLKINHQKSYADGDIHANTIESFWSLLKRGVIVKIIKIRTVEQCRQYECLSADKCEFFWACPTESISNQA